MSSWCLKQREAKSSCDMGQRHHPQMTMIRLNSYIVNHGVDIPIRPSVFVNHV